MNGFFETSRPLPRAKFIALCQESSKIAQLIFAPLGLPSIVETLDIPEEESLLRYRQWEDALSVHIYNWKQIPADRVASSMHHYLEVKKDPVVIEAIREEAKKFNEIMDPPRVLELISSSSPTIDDLNTAATAALLVHRVLAALSAIQSTNLVSSPAYWRHKYGVDDQVESQTGASVSKRLFSPGDLVPMLKAWAVQNGDHDDGLNNDSLTPPALHTLLTKLCTALCIPHPDGDIQVSVHQYFDLVSSFASSEEVQKVLLDHLPPFVRERWTKNDTKPNTHPCSDTEVSKTTLKVDGVSLIDAYRIGLYHASGAGPWAGLGLAVDPLVSILQQLYCDEDVDEASSLSSSCVRSDSGRLTSAKKMAAFTSIKKALSGQRRGKLLFDLAQQGTGEDEEEEGGSPLDAINEAIDGDEEEDWVTDDGEEDEKECADQEDTESPALPCALLPSLLVDRAQYTATCYSYDYTDERSPQQKALDDLSRAIEIDPYFAKAYGLRAQLSGNNGDDDEENNENDDEKDAEESDELAPPSIPRKHPAKMQAAKDALAAFLLGGSADLALAASAEDALREESKTLAKQVYESREKERSARMEEQESPEREWVLPCMWQTQAYLAGFDVPSVGLELGALQSSEEGVDVIEEIVCLLEAVMAVNVSIPLGDECSFEQDDDYDDADCAGVSIPIPVSCPITSSNEIWTPPPNSVLIEHGCCTRVFEKQATVSSISEGGAKGDTRCPQVSTILAILSTDRVEALAGIKFIHGRVLFEGKEDSDEDTEDEDNEDDRELSCANPAVKCRLLSLAGSICFLLGLTKSALRCFRHSLAALPLADTYIKLAALLCDMDDPAGAHELFSLAHGLQQERNGGSRHGAYPGRGKVFCLLHMAELASSLTDFEEASALLKQAKRVNADATAAAASSESTDSVDNQTNPSHADANIERLVALQQQHYAQVQYTILTLLGVTLFRLSPNSPEESLDTLRPAVARARNEQKLGKGCGGQVYLFLCYGEVLAQNGDLTGSLALFKEASCCHPTHPLPFVNAGRTYLQLNQKTLSQRHIDHAISLDPCFPLPHVDLAQSLLYQGKIEACNAQLDIALKLAKHVGDIKDVVVAQLMAALTKELQDEGLFLVDAVQ